MELFECHVVPDGQLVLDFTLQALVEGLSKGYVIQIHVLKIDHKARDVVGNCYYLLQVSRAVNTFLSRFRSTYKVLRASVKALKDVSSTGTLLSGSCRQELVQGGIDP